MTGAAGWASSKTFSIVWHVLLVIEDGTELESTTTSNMLKKKVAVLLKGNISSFKFIAFEILHLLDCTGDFFRPAGLPPSVISCNDRSVRSSVRPSSDCGRGAAGHDILAPPQGRRML